jgi:hypothetical protein
VTGSSETSRENGAFSTKLFRLLFERADIASLVYFRIVFGAIMVWEAWRYFSFDWIRTLYIEPPFFFKYYGFEWISPWPGVGMHLHFAALGVLYDEVEARADVRASLNGREPQTLIDPSVDLAK